MSTQVPAGPGTGARRPAVAGTVGGVAAVTVLAVLDGPVAVDVAAVSLAVVYAIYVGLALAEGPPGVLGVELAFAALGMLLVGLGLWVASWWLGIGYAAHAGWDLLHGGRRHVTGTRAVPGWYVPLCVTFDLVLAVGVVVVL